MTGMTRRPLAVVMTKWRMIPGFQGQVLGPGQEGEGCPNQEGKRFPHVMTMRHFVSGGRFIVALNLQRLDQPQRLLVLTDLRVKIQGFRTFEATSSQHHVVAIRLAVLVTVEGRVMAGHLMILQNLLVGMILTIHAVMTIAEGTVMKGR